MRRWIAGAVIAVLAACSGEPVPPDMKDPVSVARAFVDAYNGKDLARMLPLVDQVNMEAIKDALADGPDSTAWQGIFAPEMVQLIAREGGKVVGPRYEGSDAVVSVAKSDLGDVFTVDTLGHLLPQALPEMACGDLLCIHDTGAYGASMASTYNAQPLAAEVLVDG